MKSVIVAALLIGVPLGPTAAQTTTIGRPDPNPFSTKAAVRVTESFTVPLPSGPDVSQEASDRAIAAARRTLYGEIQKQCGALGESFSAECRVTSFSVSVNRNPVPFNAGAVIPAGAGALRSVDATATYALAAR